MAISSAAPIPASSGGDPARLFRQLVVVAQSSSPNSTHLLVRSTSPTNAESGALNASALQELSLSDETDAALRQFRESLHAFLIGQAPPKGEGWDLSELKGRLKLVMNIHGYSTPLRCFLENAYQRTENKFKEDSQGKTYSDYILFIDYSWPSEQAFSLSIASMLRAMPFLLRLVLGLALGLLISALPLVGWAGMLPGLGVAAAGGCVLGIGVALLLLRKLTYFRDRERAASAGVYDAMELVRWVHQIFKEELTQVSHGQSSCPPQPAAPPVELSILAHSMGCFVATQLVRTLSDVFDPEAIKRWQAVGPEGPFSLADPCANQPPPGSDPERAAQSLALATGRIGDVFQLRQLVLASPDIPVWALTNGRANPLQACLRRFQEVFIFTNDADVVLRLASTLANFFVFPSSLREGGYRLGNVVNLNSNPDDRWKRQSLPLNRVGLHGFRNASLFDADLHLTDPPFSVRNVLARQLCLIDCTDYIDRRLPAVDVDRSPRLAASGPAWRPLRYLNTLVAQLAGRLDSHGGYFDGRFCLDLIYYLLLFGSAGLENEARFKNFNGKLRDYQMSWVDVVNPDVC